MRVDATKFDSDEIPEKTSTEPYRQLVGCLMYAMVATRPDIAFAVGYLSRFVSKPTTRVWTLAKEVLRYLQGSSHFGLCFRKTSLPFKLTAFVDADWGRDRATGKSVTGLIVFLGKNLIAWASRQQKCVALSSTEAEYIALSEVVKEVLWTSRIVRYLGLISDKVIVYEDNQGAIKLATNTITHKRSKHVNIRYHFVRQHVSEGDIVLQWIQTKNMLADALTKPLAEAEFKRKRKVIMNHCPTDEELAHLCLGIGQKRKSQP
jgi:hypothetical protein